MGTPRLARRRAALAAITACVLAGCEGGALPPSPGPSTPVPSGAPAPVIDHSASARPHDRLREAIRQGRATEAEVLAALAGDDVKGLANTLHALYWMGDSPWVRALLLALWDEDLGAYPELDWGRLSAPAVRVAVASTRARLDPTGREGALAYLREALEDPEPFVRAQAAVGLGLAGSEADVPRLAEAGRDDSPYVAGAAVLALRVLGSQPAWEAVRALRDDPRLAPGVREQARQALAAP
jgi:hypothetical protein